MAKFNATFAFLALFMIVGIANARLFKWRPSGGGPFPGGIPVQAPGAAPVAQQGPFPGGIAVPAPAAGSAPVASSPLYCYCGGGYRGDNDASLDSEGFYDMDELLEVEPLQ